ncbi:hypothetical protein ILT44_23325 [Microvirga sp. BT689]|uniref:hypothetical protein n=1 Tax=Microvirga arvi TaxID=2778731 RepID=UPI00194E11BA|nr:hypothetical protein [Microvirga arvi]MBM6583137.1 hypothetical protein [Microvirga arvi]
MASTIEQLVSELGTTLLNGLDEASRTAQQAPGRFADVLSEAVGEAERVTEMPSELWDKLKQAVNPPDWLSLMIFLAVQLQKAVGEKLKVGVLDPGENWNRALLLTYTEPVASGDAVLSLAIALGEKPISGFIVSTRNNPKIDSGAGPVKVAASGDGDVEFRVPIGGAITKQGNGRVSVEIEFAQPILPGQNDAPLVLAIGVPSIGCTLSAADDPASITWSAFARMGNRENPGFKAAVDLKKQFGDLWGILNVNPLDERYSPSLTIAKGKSPTFDLGHASAS